jgi:hypothetical protein
MRIPSIINVVEHDVFTIPILRADCEETEVINRYIHQARQRTDENSVLILPLPSPLGVHSEGLVVAAGSNIDMFPGLPISPCQFSFGLRSILERLGVKRSVLIPLVRNHPRIDAGSLRFDYQLPHVPPEKL